MTHLLTLLLEENRFSGSISHLNLLNLQASTSPITASPVKYNGAMFGLIFFITQFPSLITHHFKILHSFGTITQYFSHYLWALFLSLGATFFFFFPFSFQYPYHPNPVKEEGKKKSKNTRRRLRSSNPGEERKKKRQKEKENS